jgi:phosphodiesterase/alkaline phosphatase D-like protein
LVQEIKNGAGDFTLSADLGLLSGKNSGKGSAGFNIGVKDQLDPDIKSACYFGKGIPAGISLSGNVFIARQTAAVPAGFDYTDFSLSVIGKSTGKGTALALSCKDKKGKSATIDFNSDKDISGITSIVNNFDEAQGENFWFRNFNLKGSKVEHKPQNGFGPILWAMYTLSKHTLKLTAQMPPIGAGDNQEVELYFKQGNAWQKSSVQKINPASYTAHFQIDSWIRDQDVNYQFKYKNKGKEYTYNGTIRKEPLTDKLSFGGLTCQHSMAFPYGPLVSNLQKHNPDILYFSGDQLYEQNGGYPIKRNPEHKAILSYLGKWYMFGWAFGNVMRDRPTICTPDDHDVFQGNLWGDGGKPVNFENGKKTRDAYGGYVQTPKMVNVVGRTQCGHMPASFHQKPLDTGIETWHTSLLYGKVSFAIISDRMFKTGPELVRSGPDRIDHVKKPTRPEELESAQLEFLGAQQMEFLEHWINDWEGANMKVLLSQTLFANVGTHHGDDKMFLYGDLDSGGWPKKKKDDAVRLIRKACTFHINGDQHLPFIVQYSLDNTRDAGWTFCTPAVSTGYIRWGQPDVLNTPVSDRPAHGLPDTGIYKDVFGNTNYIYAVGNPDDDYKNPNRYKQAQNKASGFGMINFDTNERTIHMDAFRFLADKDRPTSNDRFPGWPLTITQADNDGRKPTGYLPKLQFSKADQVVKIIKESDNELVNILRTKGTSYQPAVYAPGSYTLIVGEGKQIKTFKGIKSTAQPSKEIIKA